MNNNKYSSNNKKNQALLPEINILGKQQYDLIDEVIDLFCKHYNHIYIRSEKIVEITNGERGLYLKTIDRERMAVLVNRCAKWIKKSENAYGDIIITDTLPSMRLVTDFMKTDLPFPVIDNIYEYPVVIDNELISQSGYNSKNRIYIYCNLDFGKFNKNTSIDDVKNSVNFILNEMFIDFPFVDKSSKANALALLLLPYVRPHITGATPLHLINAPRVGTGKDLLGKLPMQIALGRKGVSSKTENYDDTEWKKQLSSWLGECPPYIYLENINYSINSASLTKAISSTEWRDRQLGRNDNELVYPLSCIWFATGNNVKMSDEVARRTVQISLDANMQNPSARSGWRHPLLPNWVVDNRKEIMSHCLTIIQFWLNKGSPKVEPKCMMGGFEDYCAVMNGIMSYTGCEGFLDNRLEIMEDLVDDDEEWQEFIEFWGKKILLVDQTTEDIVLFCQQNSLLTTALYNPKDKRHINKIIGFILRKKHNQVTNGWKLVNDRTNGVRLWNIKKVEKQKNE